MEEKSGESSFVFATDAQGEAYCLEIVDLMVSLFEIPYQEAIGRVNRAFSKVQIVGDDMIYHEDPDYWARQIYYVPNTYWWLEGQDLQPENYP